MQVVEHEQNNVAYCARFMCAGWTPVIGNRSWHKLLTRLVRLRAPPHARASLPSSDSSTAETSDWDCFLHIPADVADHYSPHNRNARLWVTTYSLFTLA